MKNPRLYQLFADILPELLNKIIALGEVSITIKWDGQEFNLEYIDQKDIKEIEYQKTKRGK